MHCRLAAALAICAACFAGVAAAQPGKGPAHQRAAYAVRTAFGRPNLEGTYTANFVLVMEASKETATLVLSEAEARVAAKAAAASAAKVFEASLDPEAPALLAEVDGFPLVRGERRTRALVKPADGRLPYTEEGRREAEGRSAEPSFDNPENRSNSERCLVGPGQPPITAFIYETPLLIVQTRDYVLLHTEYGNDLRIIPFADHHRPKALISSKLGDSIARWDGDTLVIETIGLPNADRLRFMPTYIVSHEATVIERLTRVSASELLYQFTVIDPKVYAGPGWPSTRGIARTSSSMSTRATRGTTRSPAFSAEPDMRKAFQRWRAPRSPDAPVVAQNSSTQACWRRGAAYYHQIRCPPFPVTQVSA